MPRSRWKVRKESAPGFHSTHSSSTPAAAPAAADQERNVARPFGVPTSTSAGHTFRTAPKPASAPSTRGPRPAARSPATATAVTITSYRAYAVGPSSATPASQIQAPREVRPARRPVCRRRPKTSASQSRARTKKAAA